MKKQHCNLNQTIIVALVFVLFTVVADGRVVDTMVAIPQGASVDYRKLPDISVEYDYEMAKYPVTNVEYVEFLNAAGVPANGVWQGKELIALKSATCQVGHDGTKFHLKEWRDSSGALIDIGNYPVVEVNWFGAAAYCNRLSRREGLPPAYDENNWELTDMPARLAGYRLPTEDEWEFAARGGAAGKPTAFAGSDSLDQVGWYTENSNSPGSSSFQNGRGTMPVGQKAANELGLYDMSGNVKEMTNPRPGMDYSSIAVRGGSWRRPAFLCGVSASYGFPRNRAFMGAGFRIVRTADVIHLPAETITDFSLPRSIGYYTNIAWESGNPELIKIEDGKAMVTQPENANSAVILTAAITKKGDEKLTREFKVTVLQKDAGNVKLAEKELKLDLGGQRAVRKDLRLPLEGRYGTKLTWESSKPERLQVVGDSAKVTRPVGQDEKVELTAVIGKGDYTAKKTFPVTLRKNLVATYSEILEEVDVAPVWSVHEIGHPNLVTRNGFQYLAYYDSDRHLAVAQRKLNSAEWRVHTFPVQMGWPAAGHAKLTLGLDRDGHIHVSAYRRWGGLPKAPASPPRDIYYRSTKPHDVAEFERKTMLSPQEWPGYPTFLMGPDGELFFTFRRGQSGRGDQVVNVYDPETQSWRHLHNPLFDGCGQMNAYVFFEFGPDQRWHAVGCWRDTGDIASNHTLFYARSQDFEHWETIAGKPLALPITSETAGVVVDPAGPGAGITNVHFAWGWDSEQRPVVTYHKYDGNRNSQIYNARFDGESWLRIPATDWDFRWDYNRPGGWEVLVGPVAPEADGRLVQLAWSRQRGLERILLDAATLRPLERARPELPTILEDAVLGWFTSDWKFTDLPKPWRLDILEPESAFVVNWPWMRRMNAPMLVTLIADSGRPAEKGVRYIARWEHAGRNLDKAVPEPWPAPTMLRVYKIRD